MDQSRFQQQPMTSGLTRYRSAPSSYFTSLLSNNPTSASGGGGSHGSGIISGGCGYARDDFTNLQTSHNSTSDIEQVFARFVASIGNKDSNSASFVSNQEIREAPPSNINVSSDFIVPKQEVKLSRQPLARQRSCDYSLGSQMNYESQVKRSKFVSSVKQEPGESLQQLQQQQQQSTDQIDTSRKSSSVVDNSFVFTSPMNSARLTPVSIGGGVGAGAGVGVGIGTGGGNSNLTRYNSSPAGFFAQINIENDYGIRGIGSYGTGTSATTESSLSTPRRTKLGFPTGKPPAPPGMMAPISEIGDKGMEESSTSNEQKNDESCITDTDFPMPSWEDSHILSDDFLKAEDIEIEPFSNQNNEGLARPPLPLAHHMSLPTSTMEKLLQDSVPLNVRAKRGCATHPRSIAERVRRTKISDRMRRLQDLVPNMDRQTNTADMLDFAVDYIKELEKQVKILAERRAKCTCTNK